MMAEKKKPPMYLSTPIKLVGKEQPELSFIIHATKQPGEFNGSIITVCSVTQERGNSAVHQKSLWSAVGDDITVSQQPAESVSPFAKECWENTTTTAVHFLCLVKWNSCVVFLKVRLLFYRRRKK